MAKSKRGLDYLNMSLPLETVQPDYAHWQAVQIGMSMEEAIEILGRPVGGPYTADGLTHLIYGYLRMPLNPSPTHYLFELWFSVDGLYIKKDPFNGVFSIDGSPTKAEVLSPTHDAIFRYEPFSKEAWYAMRRPYVIDVRWHPVSGQYPMEYELEMGTVNNRGEPFGYVLFPQKMPIPYFVWGWHSPLPGCFRVRGVNNVGVGEWSDYRYFDFLLREDYMPSN